MDYLKGLTLYLTAALAGALAGGGALTLATRLDPRFRPLMGVVGYALLGAWIGGSFGHTMVVIRQYRGPVAQYGALLRLAGGIGALAGAIVGSLFLVVDSLSLFFEK
jgi:hypothetical protein